MDQALAPGIEEMNSLQQAGFTPSEIDEWKANTTSSLQEAGFNSKEVDDYFGVKVPDMTPAKEMFKTNTVKNLALDTKLPAPEGTQSTDLVVPEQPKMKEAESFIEAIEAGFDMSVTGLIKGRPDVILPEHAPMFFRIASQISQMAGDVPAMLAGALGGGSAGAAIGGAAGTATLPVVGTIGGAASGSILGAGYGGMALPEAMRTVMMEHYQKGDVQSFSDFWERVSAVAINSTKAGTIGALTMGVGNKVGGFVQGLVGKTGMSAATQAVTKTTAQLTSEIATMTTVGAALDGRLPEPSEFIDAGIVTGFLIGSTKVASKMRASYAKSGVAPIDMTEAAQSNPKYKQQLLSDNVAVPANPDLGITTIIEKAPDNIPTTKPLREPKPEYSAEVNEILGKVGEQPDAPKKPLMSVNELYTNFVDKLDPINQATKTLTGAKELLAENNPYVLARTAVDAPAKAKHFFENGVLDFKTLDNKGGSLSEVLKSVDNVEVLEAYMISKRTVEKAAQGINTGFNLETAQKVVAEHGSKYDAAAKQVADFSNNVLKYVADSGVLSKEQYANMLEANKDYVPFKRIMEADGTNDAGKKQGKAGSLKQLRGSDRAIQSPILSIVENTVELIKMAENNRPKQALVKLAEQTPDQALIKKVPAAQEAIKVNAQEIIKHLEETEAVTTLNTLRKNLESKGLKVTDEQVLKAFENEQGITETSAISDMIIFRKARQDLTPNQFSVFKDGKRQVYETTPDLAEAIKRLDGDSTATNLLFKIMHKVTNFKKIGITFTPDFVIRNFFRDTLTANTFSSSKAINPLDVVSAIGDIWKKNETYYNWLKSGGANGAFLEMGDRYIKNDIYKLSKETGLLNSARNIVMKPIDVMRVAAELTEQSLRVAEFKKVREKGGSLTAGGMASREITIDFQRVGAKVSALNSITAFMNVSIQGLDRTARAFKENPSAVLTKSVAYITVPSILLWWANKDDPRYQEIPRWEKDAFWIIPTDNWKEATPDEANGLPDYMVRSENGKVLINKGTIYRLPKPQELGIIFGSLPERTLEKFFTENPSSYKEFGQTMLGIVTPSFVPDAVAPAIEQYFNKSFFTGRDIVPHHLAGVLPEYQFVEYTSETAKAIGKMISTVDRKTDFASPMVLQNYIRSWGGALGQYAVQVADKALVASGVAEDKVKPSSTLADVPFVKSFIIRFPMAGTNSVQDFQDSYKENKQILDTIRHLAKEGDFKSMEKELVLNANQDNLVQLDGIQEALSNQSKLIRLVSKNPDMSPDEKRQIIDGAYLMMTEVAKQGNVVMQEIKKQLGEK